METSGRMVKSCWRRKGKGGSSPKQLRQHDTSTCDSTGIQAATPNSPLVGTSEASTSAAPIGAMSLSGPRHPRQHRPPRPRSSESCQCGRRGPTTRPQSDSDSDSDDDTVDLDENEVAELVRKERQRLARRWATQARYRARHPERVAEQKRRYRAKHPERVVEQKRRYRVRHPERITEQGRRRRERNRAKIRECLRQYYAAHGERFREHKRQFYRSQAGQGWQKQYLARKREASALLRRQRGAMVQKRTEEKRHALGPLKLTVTLEDFMQDFHDSFSPTPEDSMDQPSTIMDMDSGVLDPLDHSVCDESSLSSCDMWDDGKGFLDNLLEELDDLPSSDDCLFDFLTDMMLQEDPSFDLDDFVT